MSAVAFTPPGFPKPEVRSGLYTRLEPLDPARHTADLWAAFAGHAAVWEYLPAGPYADQPAYRLALDDMAKRTDIVAYCVIDRQDGRAKGHFWLMEIRPAHGVLEIGYIAFSPALQRTRVATEAVYLAAASAFASGYRRFEWKCNNRNEPSKRAALRFGFTFEGVFRQHMVVKGKNRDTAWYSIVDHEWPLCAEAFRRWLDSANFDADGEQRERLETIRGQSKSQSA
jgi:RimJ/RimL family protein N-acetyltransferase